MTDPALRFFVAEPTELVVRLRLSFQGRVQGVGFRATARDTARRFAVAGWVRNEPDGSVAMEIQGAGSEVAACLERLRARLSRNITQENQMPIPPRDDEDGFDILR